MQPMSDADNQALQEFRGYLETLTFIQIDPRLRIKFDLSDIIQNTLLEAFRDLERIQTLDVPGRKRWLRRMLVPWTLIQMPCTTRRANACRNLV
jgi:hypothetical protein